MSKRVLVARIGAAHGVRGEVRVKPFTADPVAVADYGPLTDADGRAFEIVRFRPADTVLVVKFAGIDDRNAAEALNGHDLFVDRDALPATEDEDEFYHADLIGLAVVTAAGETVGTVVALHDFGAGDLIEVARPGAASVYVPFTKAVVPSVDVEAGRLVIEPPAGLLDPPKAGETPPPAGRGRGV